MKIVHTLSKFFYPFCFLFSLNSNCLSQTPYLKWAETVLAFDTIAPWDMDIDPWGGVITVGDFSYTVDCDPGPGIFNLFGSSDIFVQKLDSNGLFQWAVTWGGPQNDHGWAVAVDDSGNVLTTGSFRISADFDPGPGVFTLVQTVGTGAADCFVQKLDPSGNLVWAKKFDGLGYELGYDIETDDSGNVYVTAEFSNTIDLDPGPGIFSVVPGPWWCANTFLVKLDVNGNFVWAKTFISPSLLPSSTLKPTSLCLDEQGNVILTGSFSEIIDFDPGPGIFNLSPNPVGATNLFILKLSNAGNFIWAKQISGSETKKIYVNTSDTSGGCYLGGYFYDSMDFDPGPGVYNITSAGDQDIFFEKLDSSGNFLWAYSVGSDTFDYYGNIFWHEDGYLYSTGTIGDSADFDPSPGGTYFLGAGNTYRSFIMKTDTNANLIWVREVGSLLGASGGGVMLDNFDNIYQLGSFEGVTDFDPTPDVFNLSNDGYYVLKWKECGPTFASIPVNSCDTFLSPSGNFVWSASGNYLDTIPNSHWCDSLLTIQLTINSSDSTLSVSSCDSFLSPSGSFTWNSPGVYFDTIPNAFGCDSLLTINLSLLASASAISMAACDSVISPSGNFVWSASGIYQDTILNSQGCDSAITVNFTLTQVDVSVNQLPDSLIANASGATYQWLNCASGFALLPGDTLQSFYISSSGIYAVEVTQNGCTDTSACITVLALGNHTPIPEIRVFPNPGNREITVKTTAGEEFVLEIYNAQGQLESTEMINGEAHLLMESRPGIYFFVFCDSSGKRYIIKFTKI